MIDWRDTPDSRGRFVEGRADTNCSVDTAIQQVVAFLCDHLAGNGNGEEFNLLMLEVACSSGHLLASVSTEPRWKAGRVDACWLRLQEVQDVWYDLDYRGASAEDFDIGIDRYIMRLGDAFMSDVKARESDFIANCSSAGFDLIVFGAESGVERLRVHFPTADGQ
jgi:hypothetical protein